MHVNTEPSYTTDNCFLHRGISTIGTFIIISSVTHYVARIVDSSTYSRHAKHHVIIIVPLHYAWHMLITFKVHTYRTMYTVTKL